MAQSISGATSNAFQFTNGVHSHVDAVGFCHGRGPSQPEKTEVGAAWPIEVTALNRSVGQTVSRLRHLRTSDGRHMAIESAVIPPLFLPVPEMVAGSLYDVLAMRSCWPAQALQRLRAAVATVKDAKLLGLEPGAALGIAGRRCFGTVGAPVDFTQTRNRGEGYDVVVELRQSKVDSDKSDASS